MIISFVEYKMPLAKNIFWAFCAFYGFTFAIGKESVGTDILQYMAELQYLHEQSQLGIAGVIDYFKVKGDVDIFRTILSFILSRFTDSQVILTLVYAVIFGFFYSRNVWYIFSLIENRLTILEKMIFLSIILLIPIWFINGFRMWTAFHIFMYGLLPFIFEKKKIGIFFMLLSFWYIFLYNSYFLSRDLYYFWK
ncbi:MAG: hypothetical protein R2821_08455 [Flavobacteriaceae bacterium]